VLHLLAGLEDVAAGRNLGLLADALTPAEGGQGRVGDLGGLVVRKLFGNADEVAVALLVEPLHYLDVVVQPGGAVERWDFGIAARDHRADGLA
jgi:hypothetical protein